MFTLVHCCYQPIGPVTVIATSLTWLARDHWVLYMYWHLSLSAASYNFVNESLAAVATSTFQCCGLCSGPGCSCLAYIMLKFVYHLRLLLQLSLLQSLTICTSGFIAL